jgi:hypothetical protein
MLLVSFKGVHLLGVHLIGGHLISEHLMNGNLMGKHLMGRHLVGVYLMGIPTFMGGYPVVVYFMGVDLPGRNCYPTPAYHCVGWVAPNGSEVAQPRQVKYSQAQPCGPKDQTA